MLGRGGWEQARATVAACRETSKFALGATATQVRYEVRHGYLTEQRGEIVFGDDGDADVLRAVATPSCRRRRYGAVSARDRKGQVGQARALDEQVRGGQEVRARAQAGRGRRVREGSTQQAGLNRPELGGQAFKQPNQLT